VVIRGMKVVTSICVDLGPCCFNSGEQVLNCTNCMSDFIGFDKLSNLVTTLLNHASLLQGGFMEGE
jgi:hypothetical protein